LGGGGRVGGRERKKGDLMKRARKPDRLGGKET